MTTVLGIIAAVITFTFMVLVCRTLIRADRALRELDLGPADVIFRGPYRGHR